MRIPEKRVCDLCRNELTGSFIQMAYPLDPADRTAIEAQLPKASPTSLMFGFITVTPEHWRFEFCRGCAEGFMPMLAELKTQAITAWLEERARRAEAPIGEREG